jgi:hypothetical protein
MLFKLFYFRFSSHLIEKRPFCCIISSFVSSTDAMTGQQAGQLSESTAFMRRITCSLLLRSDLFGNSTTLNRLQFDVWVFGIAYMKIALFEMALTQFFLHVLHIWKDNDQVDARLPQGLRRLPQGLPYVFSKYSGWQSMKSMTVSSMESVSGSVTQRQRSHPEHLSTAG